jgi:DNA-3-methyladenine glycosylase I
MEEGSGGGEKDRFYSAAATGRALRCSDNPPMTATSGLFTAEDGRPRCYWCAASPAYRAYHDSEWGFPVSDDRRLFEKLCLEGFQSGLSWLTILNKREAFRKAFANFDAARVARFGERDVVRLLGDAGIVRHRGKIESTINNARRVLELREEFGSLAAYAWRFEPRAGSRPRRMTLAALKKLGSSAESAAMSKDLKKRGWSFVGPTTVYAFMQAMGLVNDHIEGCHVRTLAAEAPRPAVSGKPILEKA